MGSILLESGEDGKRAYKSLVVDPNKIGVLSSPLAVRMVQELTRQPGCALDIARSMQEDEQKVYYYLKKLEKAGIVRLSKTERRHGMTAKIYDAIAPVISVKLHEDGHEIPDEKITHDPAMLKFLSPFIRDGKLNAVIVIGDPYSHGRFDKASHEGPYAFDFGIFLGKIIKNVDFPHYKLDTEVSEEDLKNNLILIGNIKSNVVIDKMNHALPVYFDSEDDFKVVSKHTGKSYKDPRTGVILKFDNPFGKGKKVLIIGGIGSRGSRSSVIALTQRFKDLADGNDDGEMFRVFRGCDRSGNRVIDDVDIME
ncbi:MAG: helix-turn-helix domain-containing protein [Candidatus Aenigmarchaeota archaeon]|nr:helix-turn-helix domain-containing protein [Candidatus Aenigmarchaeota archaeon]